MSGSAFGASVNVNVLNAGAVTLGPTPTVTLPASGGNETASLVAINLLPFLSVTGGDVTTQGTTGAGGSSTSTATILGVSALGGTLTGGIIQVNAVHIILEGPLATGDIILSQSHCDLTRTAATTSTSGQATTSTSGQATTTTAQVTTTTAQATTTTTGQASTTTTKKPKVKCNAGNGNGSEIDPATGLDCDPGSSGGRNQGGD